MHVLAVACLTGFGVIAIGGAAALYLLVRSDKAAQGANETKMWR